MNRKTTQPKISIDEADCLTPGVQIEQTSDQAEENGAFEETALSEEEAWKSNLASSEKPNPPVVGDGEASAGLKNGIAGEPEADE